MADESKDDLLIPGLMIAGGVGLFFGSYYVKDPKISLVMKAGGALAAVGGILSGGDKLLDKFGIKSLLGGQDKKPEVKQTNQETTEEKTKASGNISGLITSPVTGSHLDPGALTNGYDVTARVFNDTGSSQRVRVELKGKESYAISDDTTVGADLGEWTIQSGQSIQVQGRVGLGTYIHLPFSSPDVELSLFLNGQLADTVNFSYD